ncbi:uncharacterized protein LOC130983127 [Arachis stenosperma]|uniref:uncharacterized protein LOC130983127 n=1 Tax=Arachis stenosperma TaxID=217475 RepID=UPI0025AB915F|nr:uncharacterized protein LOC130983127 [Arachis stenosperma]
MKLCPRRKDVMRQCAFKGESGNTGNEATPPSSAMFKTESVGIFMSSMPETQSSESFDAGESTQKEDDVFHTPPEKSSVPSSGEKPLDDCTLNPELDASDESLEFVDFGDSQGINLDRDSDLGFSETQRDQKELVSWSHRGIKRDGVDEDTDELQVKKSKISEPQSGSDFSRAYLGIESLETPESNEHCMGLVDVEHLQVLPAEGQVSGANEVSMLENECNEENQNMENSACGLEFSPEENVQKKNKSSFIFDVLRFLAEREVEKLNSDNKEAGGAAAPAAAPAAAAADDDDLNVVEIDGIDFPRPRWWPNNNKDLSH